MVNVSSQEVGGYMPPEAHVTKIDFEDQKTIDRLSVIGADPHVQRHLLPPDQPSLIDRLKDKVSYGISTPDKEGNEILDTVAYFYPYEEIEGSETIPEMIEKGILPNDSVPRNALGEIDLDRIEEISVNMPFDVDYDLIGDGLHQIIDQYAKDPTKRGSLLLFFQLRKQDQSAADPMDYTVDIVYETELLQEKAMLKKAGFIPRGFVEGGDVGVFMRML